MTAAGDRAAIPTDERATLRRAVYALLIVTSLGAVAGRIAAITSLEIRDHDQRRPFLSANDRSRWCTVRSLVEHGTYSIDDVVTQPGWDTIDMVKHDGHLYSSKPPLLATLAAGPYWVLHRLTGRTLGEEPHALGRVLLWLINLPVLMVYFVVLAQLIERYGATDWGRLFAMTVATWGTFLTTFAVSFNNHLFGAAGAAVAVAAALRAWQGENVPVWQWIVAGLATGLMVTSELPSLALAVLLAAALLWRMPRPILCWYIPAAALVVMAALATNYLAHGTLKPAYATQSLDPASGQNWYVYTYERNGRQVASYWQNPQGVDRGEPSPGKYAAHVLVGHHGVFSLTPAWLLALVGLSIALARGPAPWRALAALVALVSLVCLAFYLSRPPLQRNYGGLAAGFRWMFWFAPLWIVALLPAVDLAAPRRWARGGCLLLLAASAFSAAYPTWNPWVHPWLYNLWTWWGLAP